MMQNNVTLQLQVKETPLVSVLMTVYNREKYIAESIQSVLNSTYQNFELIILDDKSTDNSYNVAANYAEKDNRIKLFQNDTNLGQFPNRNKIVTYANGKYIKYLDSDDIIYPHGLQVMVWAIEQFPNAGIAVSYPKAEDTTPYPKIQSPKETYKEQFLIGGLLDIGPSGMIINKKCFENIKGFPENNYVGNDTVFLFNIAAKYPLVKMPTSLVWWRQHEDQAYNHGNFSNEYLFKHFSTVINALNSKKCPLCIDDKTHALSVQKRRHARYLWHIALIKKKPLLAFTAVRKSKLSFIDIISGFFKGY